MKYWPVILCLLFSVIATAQNGEWKELKREWKFGYPLVIPNVQEDGVVKNYGTVVNAPFYATKMRVVIDSFQFSRMIEGTKSPADILQICDSKNQVIHSLQGKSKSPFSYSVDGNSIKVRIFSRKNKQKQTLKQDGVFVARFEYFIPDTLKLNKIFPKDFKWGTGISAFQAEGNCIGTDWWEFADGSPDKCNGDRIGRGPDHYHLYEQDYDMAKRLGIQAHRLGLEWARIEPKPGVFDSKEIEHYRQVLLYLRSKNIEPIVTLHHFASPTWFTDKGGFEKEENTKYFVEYASRVSKEFKGLITYYITVNEPAMYSSGGWIRGFFPPGKKNILLALQVYANMLEAHGKAYHKIHRNDPVAKVSVAKHMRVIEAVKDPDPLQNTLNETIAYGWDRLMNKKYLDAIISGQISLEFGGVNDTRKIEVKRKVPELKGSLDYFALNYYSHDRVYFDLEESPEQMGMCFKYRKDQYEYTVMGELWHYSPQGFYQVLMRVKEFSKTFDKKLGKKLQGIIISENGTGEREHKEGFRPRFVIDHLHSLHRAIADGADVRIYLHWALMDNFEIQEGYWPRFGLIHINYKTLERTYKRAAYLYQNIIRNHGLTNDIFEYVYK